MSGKERDGGESSAQKDDGVDQGTNQIFRTLRFDVPKFNGSQIHQWIYKIGKFFSLQSLSKASKLQIVAFHMEGEASAWYQWMDKNEIFSSWSKFVDEVKKKVWTISI